MLFLAVFVQASLTGVTLTSPATGANLTGTVPLSATITGTAAANVTFDFINSSGATVASVVNTTAGTTFTASFDTTSIADGIHNVTATAVNTSGTTVADTNTNIRIDNTAPTATYESPTPGDGASVSGTQTINVSASDVGVGLDTIEIFINDTSVATCTTSPCAFSWDTTTYADGNHTFNATFNDTLGNTGGLATRTVTVDNSFPSVTINNPSNNSFHKTNFNINVTTTGSPTTVTYRYENATTNGSFTSMSNTSATAWNATFNISGLADGNYTLRINASDAAGNSNSTETVLFWVDTAAPTVSSFSCSDTTVSGTASCTCTATDAIDSSVTTSITGNANTDTTGTKTATCTATDDAGNEVTGTTTYEVTKSGGGGGGGGGGGATSLPSKSHTFGELKVGVVSKMTITDSAIGIKEIQIDVKNPANNVKITVTKQAGKPASVVHTIEGKVYQYLEIDTTNLGSGDVSAATIRFTVSVSWLVSNGFDKADVALYRYTTEWDQLSTVIVSESATEVTFSARGPGFSFFAIAAEKEEVAPAVEEEAPVGEEEVAPVVAPEDGVAPAPPEAEPEEFAAEMARNVVLVWVLVAILVVVVIAYTFWKKQK